MARIRGNAAALVTQASLSTITYKITDLSAGTTGAGVSLTITSVIFDSLQQTDDRWTKDSADNPGPDKSWGYNFLTTLPASSFPAAVAAAAEPAQKQYQVDVVCTPTTGQPFRIPFRFTVVNVFA